MPKVPLPPFEPDAHDTDIAATDYVLNCIPKKIGWGPLPGIETASDALAAACRGAFCAGNSDGTFEIFAFTATKGYQLSGTAWDEVTRTVGGDYTLGSGHSWDFEQFGELVLAVNIADAPQSFNLSSSTDFAALGGSPPNSKFVWQESGYVGLGNFTGDERKFRRSGLDDATEWDVGEKGSDVQEEPDGGAIQGAVGDEKGAFVFSERRIHRIVNQPGQEIGFTVETVESARGTIAPFSVVQVGSMVFYLSEDGFYRLDLPSSPIGAARVNQFFLEDIDLDDIDQVQGCADPIRPIVWWRYASGGAAGLDYTDRMIGYNWQLDRWCYAEVNLEWLFPLAMPGQTLEQVGAAYPDLDTLVPFSLDSRVWNAGRPALAGFDSTHKLVLFEGSNMQAILRTADFSLAPEGRRTFVSGFRPIGDAASTTGRLGIKKLHDSAVSWGSSYSVSTETGLIPARGTFRVGRCEVTVPAETAWKHLTEVEIPPQCIRPAGRR
jgi:hypothetical protein